jgi:RNA polymerase sigma factor (sigma-70 family)
MSQKCGRLKVSSSNTLPCGCQAHASHTLCPVAERIARQCAVRFCSRAQSSLELSDFHVAARLAAWKAQKAYRADRGAAFTTWISLRVSGELKNFIRSEDHLPRSVRQGCSGDEIPAHLAQPLSLDSPADTHRDSGGESPDLLDVLFATPAFHDRDGMTEGLRAAEVRSLLHSLTPRERIAVECLYWHHLSPRETALLMGRSRRRVVQLHSAALARLRKAAAQQLEGAQP